MTEPAYPAARAVADTVQEHFARQLAAARKQGQHELAPAPDAQTIEVIIAAAFWASLRREEGYAPKISLAFLSPARAAQALMLNIISRSRRMRSRALRPQSNAPAYI